MCVCVCQNFASHSHINIIIVFSVCCNTIVSLVFLRVKVIMVYKPIVHALHESYAPVTFRFTPEHEHVLGGTLNLT